MKRKVIEMDIGMLQNITEAIKNLSEVAVSKPLLKGEKTKMHRAEFLLLRVQAWVKEQIQITEQINKHKNGRNNANLN